MKKHLIKGNLVFKDSKHQEEYISKGYTIIPLLDNHEVTKLETVFYDNFNVDTLSSVYDTIAIAEVDKIQRINEMINNIIAPKTHAVIAKAQIIASIFILKKSSDDSFLGVHLDPSMTTEDYNNIGVWIPLCQIDKSAGRMCFLPQSQYFIPPFNTSSIPCAYSDIESHLKPEMICLDMQAGDALFFNNSMLHCTEKNTSGRNRIAVVSKLIDENAPLATVYYNPNASEGKQVSLYQHYENIFLNGKFRDSYPPESSNFIKHVPELPIKFDQHSYLQTAKTFS